MRSLSVSADHYIISYLKTKGYHICLGNAHHLGLRAVMFFACLYVLVYSCKSFMNSLNFEKLISAFFIDVFQVTKAS